MDTTIQRDGPVCVVEMNAIMRTSSRHGPLYPSKSTTEYFFQLRLTRQQASDNVDSRSLRLNNTE
jgi:hypothetical protein